MNGSTPMTEPGRGNLVVQDLRIRFEGADRDAVESASFSIDPGTCLGVVGESGSGKSTLGFAIAGLLGGTGAQVEGSVTLGGSHNFIGQSEKAWESVRGRRIGYVFQEPMTSLNPLLTIEQQVSEPMIRHLGISRRDAVKRAEQLFRDVEIPDAKRRLRQYAHEMSGGMRQRVVLAMALSASPELLIADEPTTALDVTVQAQVIDLLKRLNSERGMSLLFVSHDLNVVGQVAHDVLVMRNGAIVERGPASRVLHAPEQEYTKALLSDIPRFRYARNTAESQFWSNA